ncbi:MAG TPA: DUF2868 domain-containing protein [Phycisphaerales bacterium]|nr:DUF2868 domain-containing protein [Phycisphaerales bacterium]
MSNHHQFKPGLADRALVRAVADAERDGAAWLDGGEPPRAMPEREDEALVARARRLAAGPGLDAEVRSALEGHRLLWPAAGAAGLLAGASAAWAGLAGGGDPTSPEGADLNVLWFLQVTLGVHTAFLGAALLASAVAAAGTGHPLARIGRSLAGVLARATTGRRGGAGASAAAVAFGGRRGALLAAATGHTAGLGFVAGAVLALLVAASFREQYRFFWKSTLLSDAQAARLIGAVAAGPRAAGIPTPSEEEILAARAGAAEPPASAETGATARWAWMLVGALLIWGAGPRAIALAGTLAAVGAATRSAPLPGSDSYRRRALERERRAMARASGSESDASVRGEIERPATARDDGRTLGAPAVLGYELDLNGAWPPRGLEACVDLGVVDGAPDRRRVLEELDRAATRPRALVALFSRGETPAAAERAFLRELVARAGERTAIALTLSHALATAREDRDADRIAQRTALWRDAARLAGVPPERIVEVDLHHQTGATASRLAELLGGDGPAPGPSGLGATALALADIETWAAALDHSPASLAALLGVIERRFSGSPRWRAAAEAVGQGDLEAARAAVAESARAVRRLLPAWMPRHPGWMAAAATLAATGTLAAVALAGGPLGLAAGAWPLYAAIGAAAGELTGRGAEPARRRAPEPGEDAAAGARAAVLHALVLGLQGMSDEQVARTIDRVLGGAPEIASAADVPALTGHVRSRLADIGRGSGA